MADESGRQKGEEFNPYRAPAAKVDSPPLGGPGAAAGEPTEAMVSHLRGTGPWVLFLAVMGFIGAGFMALSGLSALVMMPFIESATPPGDAASGSGILAFTGAFYLVGGASYGVASYFLARYSQSIARVNETRTLADVETALDTQHRFWRAAGLITVVFIAFTMLFVVGTVAYMVAFATSLGGASLD